MSHSEAKPLSGGRPAIAIAPTKNAPPGPGHAPQQPTEPVDLERADGALERAGAEEEECFEDGVVDGVEERRGKCDSGPRVGAARAQHEACADAEHDDPDVLDRVQRQESLEVVLEEGVHNPADRRQRSDAEHEDAEPHRQDAVPLDEHADERIERNLDHHTAHQGRDGGRRERMCARQPDVQRDDAGLGSHADERRERDRDLDSGARRDRAWMSDRAGVRQKEN